MPTPTKGPRLGGGPAHERLILANLATQLFEHRSITTTAAKAKRVRPLAERLVTMAKRGDLASRRRVMTVVRDKSVVHFLFTEIAPAMAERPGGYTRITKIGNRKGDNAPMAVIELVMEPMNAKQATVAEAQAATRRAVKESAAAQAASDAEAEAEAEVVEEAQAIADVANVEEALAEAEVIEEAEAIADAAADEADADEADAVVEGPYGPGSAEPPADGSIPAGFPVKGNKDSMKFHTESSPWYDQTVAEVYFRNAEDAAAAGFEQAGRASAQD